MSENNDLWQKSVYVIKKGNAKGFCFTIEIDGKSEMVEFENCRYEAPTAEHAKQIDALLIKPAISCMIQKVDFAAGEKIALAHKQRVRNSAAKGGMTSEVMRTMQNSALSQEAEQMSNAIKVDETVDIAAIEADSGLIITEKVDNKVPESVPVTSGIKFK